MKGNTVEIKKCNVSTPEINQYGFNVFHKDGTSLPKGMFSYFTATETPKNNEYVLSPLKRYNDVVIEYGIQSPTGDASDHCTYTFECKTMYQASRIIDMYYIMCEKLIEIQNTRLSSLV